MTSDLQLKSQELNWKEKETFLQKTQFRPLYDRAFSALLDRLSSDRAFRDPVLLREEFLAQFDQWLHGSELNQISGLQNFPHRDFIIGVTHALDDLHITFGSRLVVVEKEYAYHRRMKGAELTERSLSTLQTGDVLVLAAPFSWYGDLHPETMQILNRCLELKIPVHIDAAWYGCTKDFSFDYSHPAIQSVAFSLSKGLGLGSHRTGVRYSKNRHAGPVTIINDFNMCIASVMWYGIHFMKEFGSDYIQNRYGEAYRHVCEKLNLRPTKAIHVAFKEQSDGEWIPVGVRPFLRYLVDHVDEFK
jgi:hypothetical protein